jgi:hypothetical protein
MSTGRGGVMDDDLLWTAVSHDVACPVCAASTGCGVAPFRGGVAVDCCNVVSAWPMSGGGWLHRLPADVGGAADPRHRAAAGASCDFPVPPRAVAHARRPSIARGEIAHVLEATTMETVLGAFETRRMAEQAVDELLAAGFDAGDLSVLGRHGELADVTPEHETAERTMAGAGIGAAVGGFGSIALVLAAVAIPGIGLVMALGPFSVALSAALGGGFVGGLIGFLSAHGVPEPDAARYAERVRAGAYVVAVHTDEALRAESVLALSGAEAPIRHAAAAL